MLATSSLPELSGRVSSLDGLRAVSILMVIFSHASVSCQFPPSIPEWVGWLINGQFGVRIFFVISGFIITLLLLKEEKLKEVFSLKNFYIRRIFRILPVYYSFILVVFIITTIWNIDVNRIEFIAAISFTTGWHVNSTWLLGHTWSLSVEEQFYLLWPLSLYPLRNKKKRFLFVFGLLVLFPVVRILVYLSPLSDQRPYLSITQGDSIIAGCLLSLLLFYYGENCRRYFTRHVFLLRVACLFLICSLTVIQRRAMWGVFTVPLANTIESMAIAWLIASFVLNRDLGFRIFNSRPMIFLGVISYSWYLWQQLFLFECQRYFSSFYFGFPFNVFLSLGTAVLSYYLIERTFERMKKKLRA